MQTAIAEETEMEASKNEEANILPLTQMQLLSAQEIQKIYHDLNRDYYWSNDWSISFYLLQACRGFIAVSYIDGKIELILPQIQKSYCVLYFENITEKNKRVIRKLKGLKENLRLRINHNFDDIIEKIHAYHDNESWLSDRYRMLVKDMYKRGKISVFIDGKMIKFRMCCVGIYLKDLLIAGEIGYVTGSVFTSLTGFCRKDALASKLSIGKIQILALARLLKMQNFRFLNLGQPPTDGAMQYKAEIGGLTISRSEFLGQFLTSSEMSEEPIEEAFFNFDCENIATALFS